MSLPQLTDGDIKGCKKSIVNEPYVAETMSPTYGLPYSATIQCGLEHPHTSRIPFSSANNTEDSVLLKGGVM